MKDIAAYQGLADILVAINTRLASFKDDDRLSGYINEILYGKVISNKGRVDLSGGTYSLEKEVREILALMIQEAEIQALPERRLNELECGDAEGSNSPNQTS